MKCPVCVENGERSRVFGGGFGWVTCAEVLPFFDEDGDRHWHDSNTTTTSYTCSLGHSFSVVTSPACPSCDYGKGEPEIKIHPPRPPDPITDRTLPAVGAAGKYLTTDGTIVTWG